MSTQKISLYLLLSLLIACRQADPAQDNTSAPPETALKLPDLLTTQSGQRIENAGEWEHSRRGEVLALFQSQVYGKAPDQEIELGFRVDFTDENALQGRAVTRSVTVTFSGKGQRDSMNLFLFLPRDRPGPHPVFLGLNFYGNHTVHADPSIPISKNWVPDNTEFCIFDHRADEVSRGVRASRWPVERLLARGYGLAVVYSGDIDPDYDDGFKNGVHRLFAGSERGEEDWGTIGAWAWGLSRAMDYLQTDPAVDPEKVFVLGHSRLGKAALWAGAQDERFAMVISNDSGCGGAALSRRKQGERLLDINSNFPHWFSRNFRKYNEQEEQLPVDQHMLLALIAPRPVYVASAQEDAWADPAGEYLSLYHSLPVYKLFLPMTELSPAQPGVNQAVHSGPMAYHMRSGRHDITRYDWERYMDFTDEYFRE